MDNNTNKDKKEKVTIYLDKSEVELCDKYKDMNLVRTRCEFISKAIKMYSTWLDGQDYTAFLTPAYESVIDGKIRNASNKLSRSWFSLSVEISILIHELARIYGFDEEKLRARRSECINEVKSINGILPLIDIAKIENIRYQEEEWQD